MRRYIHGAGVDDPQVVIEANGAKRWLHADERGSIVAETDATGALLLTHTYDPYGNPGNTSTSRFRYTGQILIPGTEANALYYYKARVYHPRIGRFMQTDPLGYKDGMNWYAYVGNDPVNRKDPKGESCTMNDGKALCKLDDRGNLSNREVRRIEKAYTKAVNQLLKDPDREVTVKVGNDDSFKVRAGDQAKLLASAKVIATDKSSAPRATARGGTLGRSSESGGPEIHLNNKLADDNSRQIGRTLVHESIHFNPAEAVMQQQWDDNSTTFNNSHRKPYNQAAEELLYGN